MLVCYACDKGIEEQDLDLGEKTDGERGWHKACAAARRAWRPQDGGACDCYYGRNTGGTTAETISPGFCCPFCENSGQRRVVPPPAGGGAGGCACPPTGPSIRCPVHGAGTFGADLPHLTAAGLAEVMADGGVWVRGAGVTDAQALELALAVVQGVDYDIWKDYMPDTAEVPEDVPGMRRALVAIVRSHVALERGTEEGAARLRDAAARVLRAASADVEGGSDYRGPPPAGWSVSWNGWAFQVPGAALRALAEAAGWVEAEANLAAATETARLLLPEAHEVPVLAPLEVTVNLTPDERPPPRAGTVWRTKGEPEDGVYIVTAKWADDGVHQLSQFLWSEEARRWYEPNHDPLPEGVTVLAWVDWPAGVWDPDGEADTVKVTTGIDGTLVGVCEFCQCTACAAYHDAQPDSSGRPDGCEGEGRCHGAMQHCEACGDVIDVCCWTRCDPHHHVHCNDPGCDRVSCWEYRERTFTTWRWNGETFLRGGRVPAGVLR